MEDTKPNVFIFDLDGTLTRSKAKLEKDVSVLLCKLLQAGKTIAVISGGKYGQFQKQFLNEFSCEESFYENLYLLPTSGAALYEWDGAGKDWAVVYEKLLSDEEKNRIKDAFSYALKKVSFPLPEKSELFGPQFEDRGTQVSFSALGQEAPVEKKEFWDPNREKRLELRALLLEKLDGFNVGVGGSTTIDVTRHGIDKEFGINEFFKVINLPKESAIFYGDQLDEGGNDFPATKTGVKCVEVTGPEDLLGKIAL